MIHWNSDKTRTTNWIEKRRPVKENDETEPLRSLEKLEEIEEDIFT